MCGFNTNLSFEDNLEENLWEDIEGIFLNKQIPKSWPISLGIFYKPEGKLFFRVQIWIYPFKKEMFCNQHTNMIF